MVRGKGWSAGRDGQEGRMVRRKGLLGGRDGQEVSFSFFFSSIDF